jgi:signal peptide peptidase SppA
MIEILKKIPIPFLRKRGPRVAVLRFSGVISSDGRLGRGINLAQYANAIEQAFSVSRLKAVALVINSPGGSPVQSNLIQKRIRALADEKGLPVFSFAEDVAASGGYLLALSGDEIFADPSSIVGSIGVVSAGFGFDKAIERFGIERRMHTAGDRKAALDPFSPEDPKEVERLEAMQKKVHETFKNLVRDRRGDRLTGDQDLLFSGEYWIGEEAVEHGLIDGLGDLRSVMQKRFGKKVKLVPVHTERGFFRRGQNPGVAASGQNWRFDWRRFWARDMINALEERSLWSRFGL